ncbi:MAG: hypothetical protein KF802_02385 [Bdellovibrionaceae bacterium]|nr:hypothetical protein [Pseudobdellovibrionaceae bacterium]
MELRLLQAAILKSLEEKLCSNDFAKFGLEYSLRGNQAIFAVDRYYVIAVKKENGRFYLRAKTVGMKLESDWFLVLDEDRLVQRITKLLINYMMKDRDVRN